MGRLDGSCWRVVGGLDTRFCRSIAVVSCIGSRAADYSSTLSNSWTRYESRTHAQTQLPLRNANNARRLVAANTQSNVH